MYIILHNSYQVNIYLQILGFNIQVIMYIYTVVHIILELFINSYSKLMSLHIFPLFSSLHTQHFVYILTFCFYSIWHCVHTSSSQVLTILLINIYMLQPTNKWIQKLHLFCYFITMSTFYIFSHTYRLI